MDEERDVGKLDLATLKQALEEYINVYNYEGRFTGDMGRPVEEYFVRYRVMSITSEEYSEILKMCSEFDLEDEELRNLRMTLELFLESP
jgi:hypothetical protein